MYLTNLIMTSIITVFFNILIVKNLFKKNINFKDKRVLTGILLLLILLPIITTYFQSFLKTILTYGAIVLSCKLVFNDNFFKTILVVTAVFIYYFCAEIIFTMFLMLVLKVDAAELVANWKGFFWSDCIISLIALSISKISNINNFFIKLIKVGSNSKYFKIVLILILGLGILGNKNGIFLGINAEYIINLLLIIIFCIIVYYLLKEKEYNTSLSDKYDQLFRYIEKYEKELMQNSLCIHEFKNQIISIKGFTSKKDTKINEYIDSIVSDLKKTESNILKNMENLPKGGLKGLIYYKLGDLEEEGIKVLLDINNNTKKSPYSKIKPDLYKDILKIIGVYLDNAIEATRLADKKEIVLEIFYEKEIFTLILSNTYSGKIKLNSIGEKRNSTKGSRRGYGLLLVEKILNEHKNITQQTELLNNYFVQHLLINFKNISKK